MEQTPIAQLNPELPSVESQHFRATVTLIWPYSSSARQLALLLAEPDLRLRRRNGQVRARFSGASAKAIATTGVGIGDEVVLSLRGAQFVTEGAISTPGKSIDWELEYVQTVVIRIYRNSEETANIELVDAPPTPAPASPLRRQSRAAPSPALQYSSPAFLKRARLSDGPFFEPPYDPLAEETGEGHDKKRRRKSYRDWKAWTYSARTPSPEKEDVATDEEMELLEASPSRPEQLPQTPTSPSKSATVSKSTKPLRTQGADQTEAPILAEEAISQPNEQDADESVVRGSDYSVLYSAPDEHLSSDAQYAFGGDTEVDTEVNTEEEYPAQGEAEGGSTSTNEPDADEVHRMERETTGSDEDAAAEARTENDTHEDRGQVVEPQQAPTSTSFPKGDEQDAETSPAPLINAPRIDMPPPTLTTIQTDPQNTVSAALLTPIGKEPGSPTLRPLDSANLPIPSPFPGERENTATSYFDQLIANEHTIEPEAKDEAEEKPPSEASYIGETSFFSSIGSSNVSAFHPNHESAFAPLRFTFGMDGAGSSRPMELSSPPPEAQPDQEGKDVPEASGSTTIADTSFNTSDDAGALSKSQNTGDAQKASENAQEMPATEAQNTAEEAQDSDVTMPSSGDDESSSAEEPDQDIAHHTAQETEDDAVVSLAVHPESGAIEEPKDNRQSSPSKHGSPIEHHSPKTFIQNQDQPSPATLETHSVFVNQDPATETSVRSEAPDEPAATHTPSQEPEPSEDVDQVEQSFSMDHSYEASVEATDDYLQDAFPMDHMSQEFRDEQYTQTEEGSVMEHQWIEDHFDSQTDHSKASMVSEVPNLSTNELSMIEAEQGHDIDEVETVDTPRTVPTKNTRSKAKAQTPSVKDEAPASIRTTRSTRSRGSVSSIARSVISPPRTRARSAKSPSQGAAQASPHSINTRSDFLSPEKNIPAHVSTTVRESPRKSLQRSLKQEFAAARSRKERDDQSSPKFELPQDQNASENEHINDVLVKDWTERNTHTEYSASPAHTLEDLTEAQKSEFDSPVKHNARSREDDSVIEYLSGTDPESKTKSKAKTGRKKPAPKAVVEIHSSQAATSESGSPSRRLRSKGPVEPVTQSPRNVRRTRRNVYNVPERQESEEVSEADPKPEEKSQQGESEGLSQAPAVEAEESMRSSTLNSQAALQRQRLMTPDATQQTANEAQSSFVAAPTGQDSLLTPQPTQATSAHLRSSQQDADMDATSASPSAQKSLDTKTTPGRNKTATHTTSTSLSPTLIEKPTSKPEGSKDTQESPSIGLSTPLSYYTPLKDLPYFLNRSSQFHSSANPDILALVTSATTANEKAKKGPKHWNTTLHITDASSWPATTTVQCFRAYREALPEAGVGDVVLLRAFAVKSLNRHPALVSADESAWCVWRWGELDWGAEKGAFGELKAREEVKGPEVERGEGEWREVERLRVWYEGKVKQELQDKEESQVKTRSRDKAKGTAGGSADA
ncbi:hypothetical protein COCC4DRAFT_162301 [Bipolaris maydis ATCC 48331]|uniref:Telomeric single stranded DNA binding POT1/Cdc13 domain-containing protein n=2 Tax=Cochliobolus heterostrophus TaxID=5016 RepID=M2T431_COCH5|nr:uncharacterized protein COCC4DRAFT_162301 [Bipolaris maydis ATCC 48331]EMD92320.1 hypothetical protein COCHEDRAFT_1174108 [Bipolaris maydis C5]ENI08011.1 hypothetical protein COCC4DRAFT_162301 [Bipolaris maydis ATCC 48331]KAJ6210117.1 hypothetical protein PSV09DRAFT_1174108 [Bipolaris maydis]KAJ6272341.1 hypothetical protein PSV08DRAFT_200546 [Bipolaris maydis]